MLRNTFLRTIFRKFDAASALVISCFGPKWLGIWTSQGVTTPKYSFGHANPSAFPTSQRVWSANSVYIDAHLHRKSTWWTRVTRVSSCREWRRLNRLFDSTTQAAGTRSSTCHSRVAQAAPCEAVAHFGAEALVCCSVDYHALCLRVAQMLK